MKNIYLLLSLLVTVKGILLMLTSLRAKAKQSFFVLASLRAVAKQSLQVKVIDYFVVPPRNDGTESILSSLKNFVKRLITASLRTIAKQTFFILASLRAVAKQSLQVNVIDYFVVPPRNDDKGRLFNQVYQ